MGAGYSIHVATPEEEDSGSVSIASKAHFEF